MIYYYIIGICISIVTRILGCYQESFVGNLIYQIFRGIAISSWASLIINCFIHVWLDFCHNFYKDESYLTHTLPVTKSKLFCAKMLSAIYTVLLSLVIIIGCVSIVFLNAEAWEGLKHYYQGLENIYGNTRALFLVIIGLLIIFLEAIYMMQAGVFGIIVGHRSNNHRILKSFIIGVFSYLFLSGFTLAILYIIAQGNSTMMQIYEQRIPDQEAIEGLLYSCLCIYLGYNIIYYIASKQLFKKGVNVD